MKNQKTMGNKGFSLVELIVVIAIMVVLVAVLAPVFTRYVERSRRATDVQNATSIADSVLTDFASDELHASSGVANSSNITSIQSTPVAQGTPHKGKAFYYEYNGTTNTVSVYLTSDDTSKASDSPNLCDATEAKNYTEATGTSTGKTATTP